MLSAKPWKPDAILRLLLSVFVCIFAGSILPSLWQHSPTAGGTGAKLIVPLAVISIAAWMATLVLLNKPWQLDNFERRLIAVLVCFSIGLFAGALVERFSGARADSISTGRMVIATLSFQGAGLIFIARFLREHQASWADGLRIQE